MSSKGLTVAIGDGTLLRLQRGDVTLLATVRQLPHFNVTEDSFNAKNTKIAVQLSSETSV